MKQYWLTKSLLNENEQVFYKILTEHLDEKEYAILFKVRMEDVVKVDMNLSKYDYAQYQRARGRIRNKHFDFVICDKATQQPLRIIELDGWTHKKQSEAESDEQKDQICKEAGLPITRIEYKEMNDPEAMIQKIAEG